MYDGGAGKTWREQDSGSTINLAGILESPPGSRCRTGGGVVASKSLGDKSGDKMARRARLSMMGMDGLMPKTDGEVDEARRRGGLQ